MTLRSGRNFFIVPNEVVDTHFKELSGAEGKVLVALVRLTWGWHKDEAPMSSSRVADVAGVGQRTAVEALDKLEALGVIATVGDSPQGKVYRLLTDEDKPVEEAQPMQKLHSPLCKNCTDKTQELKTDNTNPNGFDSLGAVSLRERVLKALAEARNPSAPVPSLPEDTSAKEGTERKQTFQQASVGIILGLWKLLWGKTYAPQPGAVVKLITQYGGFRTNGPERLAVAMLKMAGTDAAGGPMEFLFTEAKKAKAQARNYEDVTGHAEASRAVLDNVKRNVADLELGEDYE